MSPDPPLPAGSGAEPTPWDAAAEVLSRLCGDIDRTSVLLCPEAWIAAGAERYRRLAARVRGQDAGGGAPLSGGRRPG
ncbi:hypothetical protein [Streptomyces sp. NPDC058701]|uniref:hypothetical protein n=1 Tax=Streptomyces sp. NPDC058701 TaxID=3346608 RepID=UPI00365116EB